MEEIKKSAKKKVDSKSRTKELEEKLLELEIEKLERDKKETIKYEEKEVVYQTVKFRRLDQPGVCYDFLYDLKLIQLPDLCKVELKKEIVDHLNSVVARVSTRLNRENNEKKYTYDNRFMCTVLSERTKLEKVRVK